MWTSREDKRQETGDRRHRTDVASQPRSSYRAHVLQRAIALCCCCWLLLLAAAAGVLLLLLRAGGRTCEKFDPYSFTSWSSLPSFSSIVCI